MSLVSLFEYLPPATIVTANERIGTDFIGRMVQKIAKPLGIRPLAILTLKVGGTFRTRLEAFPIATINP